MADYEYACKPTRSKGEIKNTRMYTPAPGSLAAIIVTADPASTNDAHMDDGSKCFLDGKTASKYNTFINEGEALSTLKEPNGSDTSAIRGFTEKRHEEVPQNFRRSLSPRLRKLVYITFGTCWCCCV